MSDSKSDLQLLQQLRTANALDDDQETHPLINTLVATLQAQEQHEHTSTSHQVTDALADVQDGHADGVVEAPAPTGLTGSRLRSYAFAVLTRREYSKAELIEKLAEYAQRREEVIELVEELARENYQSDQRVADMLLSSQVRKGKGPQRIKMALKTKKLNTELIKEEMKEIDWLSRAYELKVKKFGAAIEKDPKLKAKQIRFLMYRGFDMDVILKAISKTETDD